MTTHLQVLVVEDVEDDLLLTLRTLRRGGYTLDYVRVETPEEMQSALDHQNWHIVIADYTLPRFSALEALKLLQAQQQDLPFIIVSGTIGEETAVAAMKAGAHDYILKGNLARLVPAVERELREAEERQKRQQAEHALRESEAALRQSQHQYQSLAETSPVGIFRTDAQGNYVYVNRQWCDMTGITLEQSRQMENHANALHPDDRDHVLATWQAALKDGIPFRLEFRFQRPDGTIIWVFGQALPERKQGEGIRGYVGTITDISDRKFAQHRVREQAALLDVTTDAILVRAMNGQISFWNKGAETLYGWSAEAALGQDANQLLYADEPDDDEIYQSLIREGSWKGERKQVTQAGQSITVMSRWTLVTDEQGQPNAILTVNTDITQAKQLESRFLRAQRLESIGTLASGIAHDLNNILTPIYGVADLLPMQLPDVDEHIQHEFEILKNSAKRGSEIINQMLLFAKGVEGDRSLLSIRYLIKEIRSFVHKTFPKSIEIAVDVPKDIDSVKGDETQLHQVFMNLFVNARDAMPNGGKLTVSAMNIQLDRAFVSSHLDVEAGPYIVVIVTDTGTGIPPDKLAYIFDPFFSTKQAQGGTGLGLSTVHGIIQSHGGFITVDTEVGRGTQFKVYLPAIEAEERVDAEVLSFPLGQGDGVLVVEDEAPIRDIAQSILESHNYKVIVATDGIDAIAKYTQHQNDIKVVLMDMTMPSLGGATAIQVMQRINPDVKVIAVSGLPSNEQIALSLGENVKAFIQKPYNSADLLKTIPNVLQTDTKPVSKTVET